MLTLVLTVALASRLRTREQRRSPRLVASQNRRRLPRRPIPTLRRRRRSASAHSTRTNLPPVFSSLFPVPLSSPRVVTIIPRSYWRQSAFVRGKFALSPCGKSRTMDHRWILGGGGGEQLVRSAVTVLSVPNAFLCTHLAT